ncbi:MAG: sporulation protein YqfC [Firmicutes bacterium]|nr:sporulation protein YqfC [Bacillota bacterium]
MRSIHRKGLISGASKLLDLPEEVVLNLPKVTVVAGVQVIIENHLGIILYQPDCLRIRARGGELRLEGQRLSIASISATEIVVDGRVSSLAFPSFAAQKEEK